MKDKSFVLSVASIVTLTGVALAQDQGVKAVIGNVFLQDTTPGAAQAGHATITGTFRAGQVFVQQGSTATIPVVGNSTATGAGTAVGGSFSSGQQSGTGVRGTATATVGDAKGVLGQSRAPSGVGVAGFHTGTGIGFGVYGSTTSATGYGGIFEGGLRTDQIFIGNNRPSDHLVTLNRNAEGNGTGVWMVRGSDPSSFFIGSAGFFSSTKSDFAVGVEGKAFGAGVSSGLIGTASLGTTRYGVRGSAANIANSYAGYFSGNVQVTGTLSKGGGSFKIDHPLDPQNKYLYHSFVESPDMMNVYSGVVTTDSRGYATITMPNWFQALNRDFRYQLTVIDTRDSADFVMAKVVREVHNNKFTVRSSKGFTKISWQVTGIRQDKWANANRIPVEEDKNSLERGTYLHPAEWHVPERLGREARLGPKESVESLSFNP